MTMYIEDLDCVASRSRILIIEKGKKFFTYKPIEKVIKMLTDKHEIYSLDRTSGINRILAIESAFVQDFIEIRTFAGSKIHVGKHAEIFVDGEWVKSEEIVYHEKIYEFNILKDFFVDTIVYDIRSSGKKKAYKIYAEKDTGIVVNNYVIRFLPKEADDTSDSK